MARSIAPKQLLIDKANQTVVIATAAAAFIFIFSLVATKTLVSQMSYQNRVIGAKETAVQQLQDDISATNDLKSHYQAFISTPQNAIGGDPTGTGNQDGDNAKIVLDALPASYDFPALANSLEKLLSGQNIKINSISGTDDEVAQSTNQSSANPQPVPMPFQVSVTGSYSSIQKLIDEFNRSIRPIQIQTMNISGDQNDLTLDITAQTFYQPAKAFNISTKVVE